MSRLIKSTSLILEGKEKVAIKVAPIFLRQENEHQNSKSPSIEEINSMVQKTKAEAAEIINKAVEEHNRILGNIEKDKQNWSEEKQALINQATEEGYSAGFQQGKADANVQYESYISEAKQMVTLSTTDYEKKLDSSSEEILSISMKVAEKIIGMKLDKEPTQYISLVQTALKEVKEKEEIRIYVSPKQYPLLIQNKHLLQNIMNSQFDIHIYPEVDLAEDGCWIDSTAGRMEVSVQTQLAEIKEKLLHLVKAGAAQ
ncbi:flagellar assembly protein FliH [Sutcliffiella deserti]|uniref:flagellar assembly protein FliH n=1 Tax=Sutcliffiella deserti TaxID=2875501 RepID=UPI001CBDD4AD|nr:flagellar assembly protein FliH [Sutcliffiella deserti]